MRDSRNHRLSVREGGATEECDLHWTVGPFFEARVHTAVVWNWVPRYSVSYRSRLSLAALLLAIVVLAALSPVSAAVVAALSVAVLTIEAVLLRLRVAKALESSIGGGDDAVPRGAEVEERTMTWRPLAPTPIDSSSMPTTSTLNTASAGHPRQRAP